MLDASFSVLEPKAVRVLLVDDDEVDREKLMRMLSSYPHGIQMDEAESVVAGIERLSRRKYDCVVLDFNLGDGEGLDLVPFVHQFCGKECPIIVVTGFGSETLAVSAIRSGVFEYINKAELNGQQLLKTMRDGFEWSHIQRRLEETERELKHRTLYDTLTGLPNRDLLHDRLDQAIIATQRFGVAFSLFLMDLDRFKEVNDSLGHLVGDQVLKEVAERLSASVRSVDTVARMGGDEFVAILPGVESVDHAASLAAKIVDRFRSPIVVNGQTLRLGISIGVAHCPITATQKTELLAAADRAMYQAKKSLNHVVVCGNQYDMPIVTVLHQALISDIEQGLLAHQFVMYFQPKVSLQTMQVEGVESLVRWERGEGPVIAPGHFIPEIEGSHLLEAFTMYVFKEVVCHCAVWARAEVIMPVAVNLSPRMLEDRSLCEKLCALCDRYEVPYTQITLEITETALIINPTDARNVITKLKARGFKISIDDFGSGYTSFSYLREFPVDEIKVDRIFIEHLAESQFDGALVRSLAVLCRELSVKLVAEGVETLAVLDILQQSGCNVAQGYYIAKPMPEPAFLPWLQQWRNKHQA